MKKKTLLITIISIIVVVAIVAGVIAYLYFATDAFKSEKELFAKYTSQIVTEDEFFPTTIEDYYTKKEMVAYENSGTFAVDTEYTASVTDSSLQEVQSLLGYANNTDITFSGKVDNANGKLEENIQVNYTDSVNLPFTIKKDGDRYGILVSSVTGENYVAVDNNNLPALLQSFGVTNVTDVPEKLELPSMDYLNFTDEEKTHISETYISTIYETISEEKFTKQQNEDGSTSYSLTLTGEELRSITSQMLEILSTDTVMLEKITNILNELYTDLSIIDDSYTITQDVVAETILDMKDEVDNSTWDNGSVTLTVTEQNKETIKFAIEVTTTESSASTSTYENTSISSDTTTNSLSIDEYVTSATTNTSVDTTTDSEESSDDTIVVLLELSKEQTDTSNVNYILTASTSEGESITTTIGYSNLNTDTPKESLSVVYTGIYSDNSYLKTTYSYENNITFGNEVTIDDFDESSIYVLNNYSSTVVLPFLEQYFTTLLEVNEQQMTQIGFPTDYGNPLLFWFMQYELIDSIEVSDTTDDTSTDSTSQEAETFNAQFTPYEGESTGSTLQNLLITVNLYNTSATDDTEKIQVLTTGGNSIVNASDINVTYTTSTYLETVSALLEDDTTYIVSFAYDSTTGKITTIYIIETTTTTTTEDDTNTVNSETTNEVEDTNTVDTNTTNTTINNIISN